MERSRRSLSKSIDGLSRTGLPLKRKFRPRCCAKTRAGAPCLMRVVPGKRRCRFHGGMSTGPKTKAGRTRIAEAQRRRWRAFRAVIPLNKKARRRNTEISSQAVSGKSRIGTDIFRKGKTPYYNFNCPPYHCSTKRCKFEAIQVLLSVS